MGQARDAVVIALRDALLAYDDFYHTLTTWSDRAPNAELAAELLTSLYRMSPKPPHDNAALARERSQHMLYASK